MVAGNNKNAQDGFVARQGDVLLVRIESRPKTACEAIARENGRLILAHGEATGHAHAIKDRAAVMFRDPVLNRVFLNITSDQTVALEHDEHTTIELPPGDYEVIRQREYSPEEIRRVAD